MCTISDFNVDCRPDVAASCCGDGHDHSMTGVASGGREQAETAELETIDGSDGVRNKPARASQKDFRENGTNCTESPAERTRIAPKRFSNVGKRVEAIELKTQSGGVLLSKIMKGSAVQNIEKRWEI